VQDIWLISKTLFNRQKADAAVCFIWYYTLVKRNVWVFITIFIWKEDLITLELYILKNQEATFYRKSPAWYIAC